MFALGQIVQAGGGRRLGHELQSSLGHRRQIFTDLVEGRLGNPAHDQLVFALREDAREPAEGMDVGDYQPSSKRRCEHVGKDERVAGTRCTVDPNDDWTVVG